MYRVRRQNAELSREERKAKERPVFAVYLLDTSSAVRIDQLKKLLCVQVGALAGRVSVYGEFVRKPNGKNGKIRDPFF